MKKRNFIVIFSVFSLVFIKPTNAQLIDNKLNFFSSYGITHTFGNETVNEDNFIFPALFTNYKNGKIFSFKALYKYSNFLSVGFKYDQSKYTQWVYGSTGFELYFNSLSQICTFGPVIQMHTDFKEFGLLNRFKFSVSAAPVYGLINVSLDSNYYDIYSANEEAGLSHKPLEYRNNIFGLGFFGSIEYSLTMNLGLYFETGLSIKKPLNSGIYNDKWINSYQMFGGIFIKLMNDKQFYL